MNLKEEIQGVIDANTKTDNDFMYISQNGLTDDFKDLFKKWALKIVGEDEAYTDYDDKIPESVEVITRDELKNEIRQRIEEAIK